MMTHCHLCGEVLGYQDVPCCVLTVPLTAEERDRWWQAQMPTHTPLNVWADLCSRQEPPWVQTYTICRACIQPVLHGGGRAAQLREQFSR